MKTNSIQNQERISLPIRFILGILLIVALSLWAFYLLMRPPMNDLGLMALFLSITAVVSALASYGAYRMGWMQRSPTIRWTLLGGYILSSVLTFLNVWMTAKLMFSSTHDLLLATVLLLFAGGIATALGYFLSTTLTDRIRLLDRAAHVVGHAEMPDDQPAPQDAVRPGSRHSDLPVHFDQSGLCVFWIGRFHTGVSRRHPAVRVLEVG